MENFPHFQIRSTFVFNKLLTFTLLKNVYDTPKDVPSCTGSCRFSADCCKKTHARIIV